MEDTTAGTIPCTPPEATVTTNTGTAASTIPLTGPVSTTALLMVSRAYSTGFIHPTTVPSCTHHEGTGVEFSFKAHDAI